MSGALLLLLGFFQVCTPSPSPTQQQPLLILSELCYHHHQQPLNLHLEANPMKNGNFKMIPPEEFCADPARILQLITSQRFSNAPIFGSLESQLCSPAHFLADYLNVSLTTCNCPQEIEDEFVASGDGKNTGPSVPLVARGFAEMVHFMKWRSIAIISTRMGWWPKLSQALSIQLREIGIIPRFYVMISQNSSHEQIEYKLRGLRRTHCRAVIVCASANAFGRAILETLDAMGLAKDQNTLTVLMDISTLPSWTSTFKKNAQKSETDTNNLSDLNKTEKQNVKDLRKLNDFKYGVDNNNNSSEESKSVINGDNNNRKINVVNVNNNQKSDLNVNNNIKNHDSDDFNKNNYRSEISSNKNNDQESVISNNNAKTNNNNFDENKIPNKNNNDDHSSKNKIPNTQNGDDNFLDRISSITKKYILIFTETDNLNFTLENALAHKIARFFETLAEKPRSKRNEGSLKTDFFNNQASKTHHRDSENNDFDSFSSPVKKRDFIRNEDFPVMRNFLNDDKVLSHSLEGDKVLTHSSRDEKVVSHSSKNDKVLTYSSKDDKVVSRSSKDDNVVSHSSKDDKVVSHSSKDDKVVSHSSKDDNVVSHSSKDDKVVSHSSKDDKVVSHSSKDDKVVSHSSKDDKVVSHSSKDDKVVSHSSKDDKVVSHSSKDDKVVSHSSKDNKVLSHPSNDHEVLSYPSNNDKVSHSSNDHKALSYSSKDEDLLLTRGSVKNDKFLLQNKHQPDYLSKQYELSTHDSVRDYYEFSNNYKFQPQDSSNEEELLLSHAFLQDDTFLSHSNSKGGGLVRTKDYFKNHKLPRKDISNDKELFSSKDYSEKETFLSDNPFKKEKHSSNDSSKKDKLSSNDPLKEDTFLSNDFSKEDKHLLKGSTNQDAFLLNDSTKKDKLISNDSLMKDKRSSSDSLKKDKLPLNDSTKKEKYSSNNSLKKDKHSSNDSTKKNKLSLNDTSKKDKLSSNDFSEEDRFLSKDSSKKDDLSLRDSAKKGKHSSNDSSEKDKHSLKDSLKKDKLLSNDSTKKDKRSLNERSEGKLSSSDFSEEDRFLSKDSSKKDDLSSRDSAKKGKHSSNDSSEKDKHSSNDFSEKDRFLSKDSSKKDDLSSIDSAKTGKHSSNDSSEENKHSLKNYLKKDKLLSNDSTKKDKRSLNERSEGKLSSSDFSEEDRFSSKDSSKKDDLSSRDSAKKNKHSSNDSSEKDKHSLKDSLKKDKLLSNDSLKKDKISLNDTSKKDKFLSSDSLGEDRISSNDSSKKDKLSLNDTSNKNKHSSSDSSEEDRLSSNDFSKKDNLSSRDSAKKNKHSSTDSLFASSDSSKEGKLLSHESSKDADLFLPNDSSKNKKIGSLIEDGFLSQDNHVFLRHDSSNDKALYSKYYSGDSSETEDLVLPHDAFPKDTSHDLLKEVTLHPKKFKRNGDSVSTHDFTAKIATHNSKEDQDLFDTTKHDGLFQFEDNKPIPSFKIPHRNSGAYKKPSYLTRGLKSADTKKTDLFSLVDLKEDDSFRTLLTLTHSPSTGDFEVNEDQLSLEEWSVKHLDQDECETCESELTKILSIVLILVCSCLSVFVLFGVAAVARYQLLKKRVNKGPYKVLLTATDFVFPQIADSRRVDEGIEAMLCCWLQQLQEFGGPEVDKPDLLQNSGGNTRTPLRGGSSPSLAKQLIVDPRVRYNGDLVQMKPIQTSANVELKAKSVELLVVLHGLRHENLNPLIGCLAEPPRACLVSEWCARGSLQDVLQQDDIKLDWSFRLSLLTDLVRGMKYLHSTPIRVHGFLTSRNCVIDARWVLKVTDYGLPSFYETQGINPEQKIARDLLWSAPELLRHASLLKKGSQPGDVYSFGIIMQEVVVRGEPFCMLALTPEEIIEKVKHPPPLIRPSVSKGAAPPEAINIMRQCWAEQAEMRPDFNAVHDQFKKLNHGRKVNIVDTMFQMLEKYSNNLEELIRERTEQLDIEKKKTEQLLNRMLPSSVAEKLKLGMPVDPEEFAEVTIYFSDIVGFTTISAHSTPFQVVDLLNDLYTCFDATINAYNVYKVETIGDAYMVVGGLPVRVPDHAEQIATMALDLLHQSGRFRIRHLPGTPLRLRIGLHTGPCCAGVVGLTMPRYCLFGDTVNTASRMESTGSAWRIHLSEATKDRLEKAGGYQLEYRGPTEIKGKGTMHTYWLLGKSGFTKTLPVPPSIELDESLIICKSAQNNYSNDDSVSINGSLDRMGMGTGMDEHSADSTTRSLHHDPTFIKSMECSKFSSLIRSQDQVDHTSHHIVKSTSSDNPGVSLGTPVSASEVAAALLGASTSSLCGFRGRPRRIEEEDLSTPYNHYKCLSPKDRVGKLLRRQFSLDRTEEVANEIAQCLSPRLCKQNSAGAADLEKIEEAPQTTAKTPTTTPVTTLHCSLSISVDSLIH